MGGRGLRNHNDDEHKGSPHEKRNVFFWAMPEKGGRGGALPEFVGPFFRHVIAPFILTSISYYVILFGHF